MKDPYRILQAQPKLSSPTVLRSPQTVNPKPEPPQTLNPKPETRTGTSDEALPSSAVARTAPGGRNLGFLFFFFAVSTIYIYIYIFIYCFAYVCILCMYLYRYFYLYYYLHLYLHVPLKSAYLSNYNNITIR